MGTVRINIYNPNVGVQGASAPQANIPGSLEVDAEYARNYQHLADSLRGLAGVELRMKDAARNDRLNSAKVNYLNDIMREAERMGNEDKDYETQRERYVQFQNERRQYYEDSLDDDQARQFFKNDVLIPTARHEFMVGQMAVTRLNDRIIANANEFVDNLTSQSGWDGQRDKDIDAALSGMFSGMVADGVISETQAQEALSKAKNKMKANQLSVLVQTDPGAILEATQGFNAPVDTLSRDGVIGPSQGAQGQIKGRIYDKAVAAGFDPRMMLGIAEAESGFNPNAKSQLDEKGRYAAGLFQFRGPAGKEVGLIDEQGDRRLDAEANINGAMRYMKTIEDTVPGGKTRPDLMVAAWLMGPNDPDIQAGDVPADAVDYVNKVFKYGYGENGAKGLPREVEAYRNLLAQGFDTQQVLGAVSLAKESYSKQAQGKAYDILSKLPLNEAVKVLADPEAQGWMGLETSDVQAVEGALYTHHNHMKAVKTEERESYETNIITQATDLSLGARDIPANPVAARQMIIDSDLDGYSKAKALKSIESDEVGKRDDAAYVSDLQTRIIKSRGIMPDSEILRGVLEGRMTLETKDKMLKLKEQAQGPYAGSIDSAYEFINEAFRGSIFMEGNPAVAKAKYEAKQELDLAVQDAMTKGNVAEILDPSSPRYILPGIVQRHYLTTQEQTKAGLDLIMQNQESARQGREAAPQTKEVVSPRMMGQQAISMHKIDASRANGQSIEDYDSQWAELRASAGYVNAEK